MPELVGERSADVVVIGGGYTGMWAAWQIKELEPEARVVLLEGEVCGYGPSGRNGGFCNVMWFSLPNMRARWGDAAALAVARAAREAVDGDRGVLPGARASTPGSGAAATCRSRPRRPTTEPGTRRLAACRELGRAADAVPSRWRSGRGRRQRCASPAFRGGAFYPDAATVQPARLALGLRERLLARRRRDLRALAGAALAGASDFDPPRWGQSRMRAGGVVADRWRRGPRRRRGRRDRRRGQGARVRRCATRSPSPPPTSSSPSRFPSCSRRSAGPGASASPTAAP